MRQLWEFVEALLLSAGRLPKDTDAKKQQVLKSNYNVKMYYELKSSHIHVFASKVDLNGKLCLSQ